MTDVIIGINPHKGLHAAVALDEEEKKLGQLAQQLLAAGEWVLDVQPKLAARLRLLGEGRVIGDLAPMHSGASSYRKRLTQ